MKPTLPLNRGRWWLVGALVILAIAGLIWLLAAYWPFGIDYYYHFYPDTQLWLQGKTQLYDDSTNGFYHPPWGIWALVPFAILPYHVGLGALVVVSILMLLAGTLIFTRAPRSRPWTIAFALFNLHTFDLLQRGQLNGLEPLGVALGWLALGRQKPWLMGLTYLILTINPPNTIPSMLFLLWYSWRQWPRRTMLTSLILPAAVFVLSLVTFPLWPLRWLENYRAAPPQAGAGWWLSTIWRAAEMLNLSLVVPWAIVIVTLGLSAWAWRRSVSAARPESLLGRYVLLLAAVFVVTPFALGYRLVLLVAVVMPYLAGWNMKVVGGLYALTFLPLVRVFVGPEYAWIDLIFVFAVFAATIVAVALPKNASPDASAYAPV